MSNLSIHGFTILETLPRGATGQSYRVKDESGRYYVLKLFCPLALGASPDDGGCLAFSGERVKSAGRQYALFRREAQVSRELYAKFKENTNSCWFFRGDFHEMIPFENNRAGAYILYDTSEGETLSALLKERKLHLDPKGAVTALKWTRRILECLRGMHSHLGENGKKAPYLHLDIKPSNIYVTALQTGEDEGLRVFKMIDLGSAFPLGGDEVSVNLRREIGRSLSATAGYAAPELSDAMLTGNTDSLSEKTDVYSVAAVLFSMLTGRAYDYDDLEIDSICVKSLPTAAKEQLHIVLKTCLETSERMEPEELYAAIGEIIDTIEHRGLSHGVLFTGVKRFADNLREKPDEMLLAAVDAEGELYVNFTHAMGRNKALCLVGSGMQGKTFSMLHCVQYLTGKYSKRMPVPLYVPLRELKNRQGKTPLSDYIVNRYGGSTGSDHAFALRESLKKGVFILLCDGLNEISGDECLANVLSEIRQFMAMGIHTAVSSQSDPRDSLLADLEMKLCTPLPIQDSRIKGYLHEHGLAEAPAKLRSILSRPMLLKMYALSERAVIEGGYLRSSRLKFTENASTAAEIMLNYREYRLSRYLASPDFDSACVLFRLFLPYLAYCMCADKHLAINPQTLNNSLDHFFHQARRKEYFADMMAYGFPTFVPAGKEEDIDEYNGSLSLISSVSMAQQGIYSLTGEDILKITGGYGDDLELDVDELLKQLGAENFSNISAYARLSLKRAEKCMELLRNSGLLIEHQGGWGFAHEELKYVFCAEYLSRFASAGGDRVSLVMGAFRLPDKCAEYAAQLGDFTPCCKAMKNRFDKLNYNVLRLMDPLGELVTTAPYFSDDGAFNLFTLDIMEMVIDYLHLGPHTEKAIHEFGEERLAAIMERILIEEEALGEDIFVYPLYPQDEETLKILSCKAEEILDEGQLKVAGLMSLPVLLISRALNKGSAIWGDLTSAMSPQGYLDMRRILEGSAAVANANIISILHHAGTLPGADLSDMDLSAAVFAGRDVRQCSMRGSRISSGSLLGFLPVYSVSAINGMTASAQEKLSRVLHMAYSLSGRYLYVLDRCSPEGLHREITHLRGFDMEEGECIFDIENHLNDMTWFWLNEKNDTLVICHRYGLVTWNDAYTGEEKRDFCAESDSGEMLNIVCVMEKDGRLYLEDKLAVGSRTLEVRFDEEHSAIALCWENNANVMRPLEQRMLSGRDYDVSVFRTGSARGRALCVRKDMERKKVTRIQALGDKNTEYLACAGYPAGGKAALCSERGIEEYSVYSGEKLSEIRGFALDTLEGLDLRGAFPQIPPMLRQRACELGAVTD